jgi:splicing factor 3B subunit 2
MKVFDLKMQVKRPDLVEAWDITAKDPLFLMELKSVRNSVPVPRHWN